MRNRTKIRLVEFFIIGLLFGIVEDVLAITLATGGHFEWKYIWIAAIVALPFAVISELIVDHPDFWKNKLPTRWFRKEE